MDVGFLSLRCSNYGKSGVWFPAGASYFSILQHANTLNCGPVGLLFQMYRELFITALKQQERKVYYLHENEWSYTSITVSPNTPL
jgi:hypothetical protein